MTWSPEAVAARLQHTVVRPDATRQEIDRLLDECLEHGFGGVMVNPIWLTVAVDRLRESRVKVCTALDFPMGGHTSASVAAAAAEAVAAGAVEIDVMTKVGWLRSGMDAAYRDHLAAVVKAAGMPVKAMLEAALLLDDELPRAVELCADAGVAWLKNSSGFDGGRATPEIVKRLADLAAGRMRVKASGGIRTLDQAVALLEAGAELLGSSASVAIVTGTGTADSRY